MAPNVYTEAKGLVSQQHSVLEMLAKWFFKCQFLGAQINPTEMKIRHREETQIAPYENHLLVNTISNWEKISAGYTSETHKLTNDPNSQEVM